MKWTRACLAAVGVILLGIPVALVGSLSAERSRPEVACEPGTRGCAGAERREEERAPRASGPERHPCDWVETCQLPCGREDAACCHAEWECPPEANLPRC